MSSVAPRLKDYADKYQRLAFERDEHGVLTVTLHTNGDSLVWDSLAHDELAYAFTDVTCDPDNKVVVLTGAGTSFCDSIDFSSFVLTGPADWDNSVFEGQRLLNNLLSIRVPVIAAVNGPFSIHAEIALLSDLIVAAESAYFQDAAHFPNGIVPGDGVHTAWMYALGPKRGKYYLLTGEKLSATDARTFGAIDEVVPDGTALARAKELAAPMAQKTSLALRYTREVLDRPIRRQMQDDLGFGLAHEALAALDL
jgi:enoyl-CoA hydratase/carnithine racemase